MDQWKFKLHEKLKGMTPAQRKAFWKEIREEARASTPPLAVIMKQLRITLQIEDPASPPVAELIRLLDDYQMGLYPAESNHLLALESLQRPKVTFLTARLNGRIVGCGAFVHERTYAELKRLFVLPEFRGMKIGRRILEELESLAWKAGLRLARLETGISQPEALGLYEKAGYRRRGPFGEYREDPLSVFMEKELAGPGQPAFSPSS